MKSNSTVIIIPARLGAIRLPKKPLIDIDGTPMIIRVHNQAVKANIGKVVIAGCDGELENLIRSYNFNYVHTDPKLASGTDRVYAAYQNLGEKFDNIINLQGDMPHVNPNTIIKVNDILNDTKNADIEIATAATRLDNDDNIAIEDMNIVKVIKTAQDIALYFTRHSIKLSENFKHIGIYGFRPISLSKFISLPQSMLEKDERLEQLRALENNMKIKVVITEDPNISIDTKEDLLKSKKYLQEYEKI
ncbi:3-deoxy-manno-octulosonate cytidylyltransferase [Candidatus Bandiella numerosa]|uniref:3-deoxy-manno-octulosonate cytidylyltransferase n=1 Tax=Candidatus Bandiella numerosa TaxID=2570586 RepID=UPI001F424740|nr:manno-octulosonate cytidylyltransferase [Candidatus Bandiella numerosa]